MNCAHPGDSCYLCEYGVVCFGLDQNMARSVCPWTLFGQHPTVNMSMLNCWKDIGTTNSSQSRWVWCVFYCSAPYRIGIYWGTPLSTSSKAKLSTTVASLNQTTEISIWGALTSTCLPWTIMLQSDEVALMTLIEWGFKRCRLFAGPRLMINFMAFLFLL